jgi:hypothetical protein
MHPLHPLVQENFYLRQRIAELERENQHIRLMLAAKTLVIENVNFTFDKIKIENLTGSLQIGVHHNADACDAPIRLPQIDKGPIFRI